VVMPTRLDSAKINELTEN